MNTTNGHQPKDNGNIPVAPTGGSGTVNEKSFVRDFERLYEKSVAQRIRFGVKIDKLENELAESRAENIKLLETKTKLYGWVDDANFKKNEYFVRAEKAEAKNAELLLALKFYADESGYSPPIGAIGRFSPAKIEADEGKVARITIAKVESDKC